MAELSGPFFQGHPSEVVGIALYAMEGEVAQAGVQRVQERLGRVLRHQTGFYSSHVVRTRRSDGFEVNDSRVVYGPWLEGTGSRNLTTRFKGYRTFRLVGAQLDRDAESLVRHDIERMVHILNGN